LKIIGNLPDAINISNLKNLVMFDSTKNNEKISKKEQHNLESKLETSNSNKGLGNSQKMDILTNENIVNKDLNLFNNKTNSNKLNNNKKDVFTADSNGEKVKINVMGEMGKSLYEKMQQNYNKFVKNTKNNDNNDDLEDEIQVVKANEGQLNFFFLLLF